MYITGFHSIEERVRRVADSKKKNASSNSSSNLTIFYSKIGPRVKKILGFANESGIVSKQVSDKDLDGLVAHLSDALKDHRGIVLEVHGEDSKPQNIINFDNWILESANSEKSTVLILDGVTDPHNIGAIIRSCDQFGADLIIIPEHGSARDVTENEVIGRSSAGASAWVPVCVVNNLNRIAKQLKDAGFWIYGADAGGTTLSEVNFSDKTAIVMGSEGTGISRLLEEECDSIVSIPTCGKIDSLNVSVAAGVLLYERYRRK